MGFVIKLFVGGEFWFDGYGDGEEGEVGFV